MESEVSFGNAMAWKARVSADEERERERERIFFNGFPLKVAWFDGRVK